MSTIYVPTKSNLAHAAAKDLRADLAAAVAAGVDDVAAVSAVAASLTTALAGANNDLVFTAKSVGVGGNSITVSYVDPEAETATESVSVVGSSIVVTLRSVSSTLSTAAQVTAAIEADDDADALVSVANSGGDTGAGVVIALEATALSGGVDAKSSEEVVADAAGIPLGEVTRLSSASALSVEEALHVALALDGPGYLAFHTAVVASLTALGPDGFDD